MRHLHEIKLPAPNRPPTIEFDQSVGAWYIRFRNGKVAKTISEDKPGVVTAVDFDANSQVLGIELVGVREFSISLFRKISPIDTSRIDFDKARFVQASKREMETV